MQIVEDRRDIVAKPIDMMDRNGNVVATVTVTVLAVQALQSILRDP
jgi:hypothetical protein